MLESIVRLIKDAGAFGLLAIFGGVVGLLLAIVTVILAAIKPTAAKIPAMLCLLASLGVLGLGAMGYALGMVATTRALGNVPEDMKDLLLRKGTEESRANFLIALCAAALPMLAGTLVAAMSRMRVGIAFSVVAVAAWGAMLAQLNRPLPPGAPPFVAPEGLQLPHSSSASSLRYAGLIALIPDGVRANGAKRATLASALDEPLVRERLTPTLPLLVDQRVPFSTLAATLESGEALGHADFELVALSASGEHNVIRIRHQKGPLPPPLELQLHIGSKNFLISAQGGALDPLPLDYGELNAKMKEIKATFPDNHTLRVTADPDITTEALIKTLDAVNHTADGQLLNDELIVAR
jgi:hypothetical protein